ncbi:MAG: hypothetical protein NTY63_01140 [Candidatus Bipolaricaulota bacterium]|nr:hypothetical protein [Candidatus Bipolaricaulota bacterium]
MKKYWKKRSPNMSAYGLLTVTVAVTSMRTTAGPAAAMAAFTAACPESVIDWFRDTLVARVLSAATAVIGRTATATSDVVIQATVRPPPTMTRASNPARSLLRMEFLLRV